MTKLLACLAAALLVATRSGLAATPAPTAAAPIILLGDGGVYARDTFKRDGPWLGLFCHERDCQLREAVVAIGSSAEKDILGEDEPTDVVHAAGTPIALIYGLDLPERQATTWFRESEYSTDAPFKKLKSQGVWEMPWGDKPLKLSWVKLPDGNRFHYQISDGVRKQFLFTTYAEGHYGGDTSIPDIYWVGDLDGDNKIDIILSMPDDNCGFDMRLYLSSSAAPGEILHKAAQLAGDQPACGC